MPAPPAPLFRFGVYRLDLAGRELHRAGKLVPMSPKMFDCLAWLFEHRARAVGRDELGAAVWNKTDVTDAQIDQLISKLRIALGDMGSDREIIRTVPRFGYRWVAEVQPETAAAATEAVGPAVPRLRRSVALAGGISLLLAIAAILALTVYLRERDAVKVDATPPAAAAGGEDRRLRERIAVLPVVIEGDVDSEWAWLRLGLMDLISSRLREGGLAVVPANNIIALIPDKNAGPLSPATVQAATEARIIVSPSLRKTSDGWRLHLELRGAENAARELEVHAGDAVASARDAADRLLVLLGGSRSAKENAIGEVEELALISRIEASIDVGDYETARQLLSAAPAALRDSPSLRLRAAEIEYFTGHIAVARDLFQSVLDSDAQQALDPATRGGALLGLGTSLIEGGGVGAISKLDEAIELARSNRLSLLYIDAMGTRAVLHNMEGREAEADSDFAQARIAMELMGDTLGLARMEANQAGGLIVRQRYADARPLLERAIARMQRFPSTQLDLIGAFGSKIYMHLALLEPRDALAAAEQAKNPLGRVEDEASRQSFIVQEVSALIANGHLKQARQVLEDVLGNADPRQAPGPYSTGLVLQAQLALASSQLDKAANLAARAMEMRSAPGLAAPHYARGLAMAWLVRTRALQRQSAIAEAAAEVRRFSIWAGSSQDSVVAVQVSLAQAEQAAVEQQSGAAISAYETALVVANRAAPVDIAKVALSYGGYLVESGQLDAATRIVGQVARWSGQDFGCALLQVQLYHALGQHKAWQDALANARSLAGERPIPDALTVPPRGSTPPAGRVGVSKAPSGAFPGK